MKDYPFEDRLREILQPDKSERGKALMGAYDSARTYLVEHVYDEIKATEPELTDHGLRHIRNVQETALRLLPAGEGKSDSLSALEMYCLGMCILFHDVGNLHSRKGHQRNIGGIFDAARGTNPESRREKTLVLRACAAHTGQSRDGSYDTLKDLSDGEQFKGERIRLRQIAAVLRLADELAEGPQRTSEHRRQHDNYGPSARLYHDYASVTNVMIDRGNERICLAYDIQVDKPPETRDQSQWLMELMAYILTRIRKLDQERRYATHYVPLLAPFKATDVSFSFHCGEDVMDIALPSLRLDDFTVPGADAVPIDNEHPAYSPSKLVPKLISDCAETKAGASR